MKKILTLHETNDMARAVAKEIRRQYMNGSVGGHATRGLVFAYAVPRGGVPAAYLIQRHFDKIVLVSDPIDADIFLDDIVDSGATRKKYNAAGDVFFALVDKTKTAGFVGTWFVFPWEQDVEQDMETTITRLLQQIGEDPERGGLAETPARVAEAWKSWTSGYSLNPQDVLKVFKDGGERYDEMVVVRGIPFYSHCEHHMAPFFGTADIGYVPNGNIVGLSKLSRLVDIFAHRLQVQERLTQQVATSLMENLNPKGVGVRITARHLCMESRGVSKQGSETVTTALLGVFKNPEVRAEFFSR